MTFKEKIFQLMKDGKWHTTTEILAVGSFGGMRRLTELRAAIRLQKYPDLIDVEKRACTDGAQFEYRFVSASKPLPPIEKKIEKKKEIKVESKQSKEDIREARIVERKNAFSPERIDALADVLESFDYLVHS